MLAYPLTYRDADVQGAHKGLVVNKDHGGCIVTKPGPKVACPVQAVARSGAAIMIVAAARPTMEHRGTD